MGALDGKVVGITADRRWEEQADLLRKRGAEVMHGPTMVTIDLTTAPALRAVTESTIASPPDWLVVTTGAGFRLWLETARGWDLGDELVGALARAGTAIVCRGAKGASAVRGVGLEVRWRAEHESMEEVIAYAAETVPTGASLTLQLFDPDDHWSTTRLRETHPDLVEVPVYRWRLPDDVGPAEVLVAAIADARIDAVTFTSQPAVRFLFSIAERLGVGDKVRDAFASSVFAVCVGPVCAEALAECGVDRTAWPDPPRLVPMIKLVEERVGALSQP